MDRHFGTMLLLSFYSVIGGWILIYLLIALLDLFNLLLLTTIRQCSGILLRTRYM
nr:hypothetical protein [Jeotgalicoccus sp. WY2]